MKVLLDTCVWGGARNILEAAGHQVEWVGEWNADPGDEEILNHARSNHQILVTLDKDFGELAIVRGLLHNGVIRLFGICAEEQGPLAVRVTEKYASELANAAILPIESWRIRVKLIEHP